MTTKWGKQPVTITWELSEMFIAGVKVLNSVTSHTSYWSSKLICSVCKIHIKNIKVTHIVICFLSSKPVLYKYLMKCNTLNTAQKINSNQKVNLL